MDTHTQWPSGIDYFDFFNNDWSKETFFLIWSNYFWNVAKQTSENTDTRHAMFRLQWLGDWLAVTNGWKELNSGITPLKALHSQLILRHNFSGAEAVSMTAEEMNLTLTEEWEAYKASNGARDFLRSVEKRLVYLDDPFRSRH